MNQKSKIAKNLKTYNLQPSEGFTFIEIVVVIALLSLLTAGTVFLLDPAGILAKSRNDERRAHVNTLLNAISGNRVDNRGVFNCVAGEIPTTSTKIASLNYDLAGCILPAYMQKVSYDPSVLGAYYTSTSSYDTGYFVFRNAITGRVTVEAPGAELGEVISVTR